MVPNRSQSKPQRMTGLQLLQRFLQGERRQDPPGPQKLVNPVRGYQPQPAGAYPQPVMTFQGPLSPVISNKIASSGAPIFSANQRSDQQRRFSDDTDVLDPISISILNGDPILGIPGTSPSSKSSSAEDGHDPDAEKEQMKQLLFGSGQLFSPRSSSGSTLLFRWELI